MDKQINHDKFHDESKTTAHRLRKLPDDGDPWAPNNLLTVEQKKHMLNAYQSFSSLTIAMLILNVVNVGNENV